MINSDDSFNRRAAIRYIESRAGRGVAALACLGAVIALAAGACFITRALMPPAPARHTVSFVTNSAAVKIAPLRITDGGKFAGVQRVRDDGYDFAGWYSAADFDESARAVFPVEIKANVTYYCKWTYTVSFVSEFGGAFDSKTAVRGEVIPGELPVPRLTDSARKEARRDFDGWYAGFSAAKGFYGKINGFEQVRASSALSARWANWMYDFSGGQYVVSGGVVIDRYIPYSNEASGISAVKKPDLIIPSGLGNDTMKLPIRRIAFEAGVSDYDWVKSVSLPEGTATVGDNCFAPTRGFANLEAVSLPDTLTQIGANAFAGTALTEILIPAGVKSIGAGAFDNCASLLFINFETREGDPALTLAAGWMGNCNASVRYLG